MKLGFWNRLAMATGGLGSVLAGTYWTISNNRAAAAREVSGYRTCIDSQTDWGQCYRVWMKDTTAFMGWDDWLIAIAICGAGAALLYMLAWFLMAVAGWVWAGRSNTTSE